MSFDPARLLMYRRVENLLGHARKPFGEKDPKRSAYKDLLSLRQGRLSVTEFERQFRSLTNILAKGVERETIRDAGPIPLVTDLLRTLIQGKMGLIPCPMDPCVYMKLDSNSTLKGALHVMWTT